MRGALLAGILAIILIIAGLSYYRMAVTKANSKPAYDALPASTALFFEFKDFGSTSTLLNSGAFKEELRQTGFVNRLQSQVQFIDSVFADTRFVMGSNTLLAALLFTEQGRYDYLYLAQVENTISRDVKIALRDISDEKKASVKERRFKGEIIYELSIPGKEIVLTCAFAKGVLMCSMTPFLVEAGIEQVKERPSIAKEAGFDDIQRVAGANASATLFVRYSRLGLLQSVLANQEIDTFFPFVEKFAAWTALDFTIKGNAFILNGYTATGGNTQTYLGQFNRVPDQPMTATQVLPNNTAIFFHKQLTTKQAEDEPMEFSYLRNWASNDVVFGIAEPFDQDIAQQYFIVASSNNDEIALQSLTELSRLAGDSAELKEYSGYKIGRLRVGKTITHYFDDALLEINDPYFAVVKGCAIFTNNEQTLQTIINRYLNGQTLEKTQAFQQFRKNLSSKYNFLVYIDPSRATEIINSRMAGGILDMISLGDKSYKKFTPMAFQFVWEEGNYFSTGFINFQEESAEIANEIWKTGLDTTLLHQPFVFIDSINGEADILVQDVKYQLYLLNKAGRIIWKKALDAPLKSQIYKVDLYNDGGKQFIFNTVKELIAVNSKGDFVESYPIKLPSPATNGLLVTDFSGNKEYQIFIACSNFSIYGYDKLGKPLPGWSPQAKVGNVPYTLQHVHVDTTDYLIAQNNGGTLLYFDRNGKRQLDPIRFDKPFKGPFYLNAMDTSFQLINSHSDGGTVTIDKYGNQSSLQIDSVSFRSYVFLAQGLAGGHHVFVDTFSAKSYDIQGQMTGELKIPSPIDRPAFLVPMPNGDKAIGLISGAHHKIYLILPDFTLAEGFPLEGSLHYTVAALPKSESKILLTSDGGKHLICYRIR
ncbi:MAG: DUF3352 domain-containing protein [Chitinophagales bacterium]|nr:DUF3352 domain-containing protein [Chitinophagales bacterium]